MQKLRNSFSDLTPVPPGFIHFINPESKHHTFLQDKKKQTFSHSKRRIVSVLIQDLTFYLPHSIIVSFFSS